VIYASDVASAFSVGLVRTTPERLRAGGGDAGRRYQLVPSIGAVHWLINNHALPENVLLHLEPGVRARILDPEKSPTERIAELFRLVQKRAIPRAVVETVAVQKDPTKRIRRNGGARDILDPEGITILCGQWTQERAEAQRHGVVLSSGDEWASVPVTR